MSAGCEGLNYPLSIINFPFCVRQLFGLETGVLSS
jgi:hypothetical protein